MKLLTDRDSVHTYEPWFQRDFCEGTKLRLADLELSDNWFCAIVWCSVNTYSDRHGGKSVGARRWLHTMNESNWHFNKFSLLIAFVRTHPNLVFLWHKGRNFGAITDDCRLATPINFIRGISAGKLDSFPLDFVSVSDERGSVINDYL